MKASLSIITTTLLGLSSVLTGVIAAPANKHLSARKTVPDITAAPYNYEVQERPGVGGKSTFSVNRKGTNTAFLNVISVEPKSNLVRVQDANNDKDPRENRIPLRDIAMYLYTRKDPKKDPKTLKKISFSPVVEKKSTNPTIKACQKKLGKSAFKVTPSDTGKEKEVFDDLAKTVFGRSVAHYKADYGLYVGAIEIVGGSELFDMDFHMQTSPVAGGPSPSPSPTPTPSPTKNKPAVPTKSKPALSSSSSVKPTKTKPAVPPKPTPADDKDSKDDKPAVSPKPTPAQDKDDKPAVPPKPTKPKKGGKSGKD